VFWSKASRLRRRRAAPTPAQKPVPKKDTGKNSKDAKQASREPPKSSTKDANKHEQAEKPKTAKPATATAEQQRQRVNNQPRPPQPVQQRREPGLFGLFR
jgi:hypothetical protein